MSHWLHISSSCPNGLILVRELCLRVQFVKVTVVEVVGVVVVVVVVVVIIIVAAIVVVHRSSGSRTSEDVIEINNMFINLRC